jgi:hypothetical protein
MLISEKHFTYKSHFSIPGYNFSHTNHPDGTAHGGTAILIRSPLTYSEQLRYAKPELQATTIQIKGPQRNIKIASIYCPPKHNLKATHFNAFFQTLGPYFIAGGDYNSKHTLWGSRLTTTKGRELASLIYTNSYSFLSSGTPTYWPTDPRKIPDLLDFFVTSGFSSAYIDIQPSYVSLAHFPRKCPGVYQEECTRIRENVPYVKVHRYNPKHLVYPKLNGYGDNCQRKFEDILQRCHCTLPAV